MKHITHILLVLGVLSLSLVGVVSAQDDATETTEAPSTQPMLGILYQPDEEAVIISEVLPDSPADNAGLEVGDIILTVNDDTVTSNTIRDVILSYAVGDAITLTVQRDDEQLTLEVILGESPVVDDEEISIIPHAGGQVRIPSNLREFRFDALPEGSFLFELPQLRDSALFGGNQIRLGVKFVMLDEPTAQEYEVEETEGALIVEVQPEGLAESAGFEVGDIVTAVDGERVAGRRTLAYRLWPYVSGESATFDILRDGENVQLTVTFGAIAQDG